MAFSVYAVLIQLGDACNNFTLNMIVWIGWRNCFFVCGGFGIISSIIWMIFVTEPKRDLAQ